MTNDNTQYEILDEPKTCDPYGGDLPPRARTWAVRMDRAGFEVLAARNEVLVDRQFFVRHVVQGINFTREKNAYMEFLDGDFHYATWGIRPVTQTQMLDLVMGGRDEP